MVVAVAGPVVQAHAAMAPVVRRPEIAAPAAASRSVLARVERVGVQAAPTQVSVAIPVATAGIPVIGARQVDRPKAADRKVRVTATRPMGIKRTAMDVQTAKVPRVLKDQIVLKARAETVLKVLAVRKAKAAIARKVLVDHRARAALVADVRQDVAATAVAIVNYD